MKKMITLILCICMAVTCFTACGSGGSSEPSATTNMENVQIDIQGASASSGSGIIEADSYKDKFIIGGQISFFDLDFQTSTDGAYYICTCVFDTLITKNGDEYAPALATEWEKQDDLTYVFKLREDVTFQDGGKFTADDVVYTLHEKVFEVPGNTTAGKLDFVENVEALDNYTVKFTLNKPHQDFLLFIASPFSSIMSRAAIQKDADQGRLIGTGPWKITNFEPGIRVEMERYDDFWGELPKPSKLEYVTYPEDTARLVALQSGETDCSVVVLSSDNATVENDSSIQKVTIKDSGFAYIAFNTSDPICADINFRKAVCCAIDKEAMVDVSCEGLGEAITSVWGNGTFGEYKDVAGYDYNPEKAKEYLAASSYDGSPVSIMCGAEEYVRNATIIADYLNEIGIKTAIDERDFIGLVVNSGYDNPKHQLLSFGATWSDSPDDIRMLCYPHAINNRSVINDEKLNEMIDSAVLEADEAKRLELYKEIQQYISDQAYYFPIYRSIYYCAEALNTSGIAWNTDCMNFNFRYANVAILD